MATKARLGARKPSTQIFFIPRGSAERFLGQALLYVEVFSLSATPVSVKLG